MIKYFSLLGNLGMFVFAAIGLISCGAPGQQNKDTFTTGEVYIAVDESLEPFVSTCIYNFENLNQGSKINAVYLPESMAFSAFLSDTIRAIIAGRKLTSIEEAHFKRIKIVPRYTIFGSDAIAFLINKSNPDSLLSLASIEKIFKGGIQDWSQISSNGFSAPLGLVFDHPGSGSITALKTYFDLIDLPSNTYALDKNTEVVNYVAENKGAIGIIGNNWINNLNSQELEIFHNKVQVALVNTLNDSSLFVRPDQTYIADSTYAFIRTIYGINRESRQGLGSGIISFIATDRGQRIMLKSGLLPFWMPPREILIYGND